MNNANDTDEFYIGYQNQMGPHTARFLRRILASVFFAAIIVAGFFAFLQKPTDQGRFEFGITKEYKGYLFSDPLPMLQTANRSYVLVGDGKFGADAFVKKWAREAQGRSVKLMATLIEREPLAMLEVIRNLTPEIQPRANDTKIQRLQEALGEVQLRGELVDSKCYLGVMRPAVGKVHKACAIRCLSGGVPAGILLRNAATDTSIMVLLAPDGPESTKVSPKWAAQEINATGTLEIRDGVPVLFYSKVERAE